MVWPKPTVKTANSSYIQMQATLGIDEVGRGAWAGPVVAAAVIWPDAIASKLIRDSKQLSPARRQAASRFIKQHAIAIGIGWVPNTEVDTNGLAWAIKQSGLRAYTALDLTKPWPQAIQLDGAHNYLLEFGLLAEATVKADSTIVAVSAASIIAKVARDNLMQLFDTKYPGYSFGTHKGYGTTLHRQALVKIGVSSMHRLSVKPVRGCA